MRDSIRKEPANDQTKKECARARILECALSLFNSKGYRNVSLRDIATAAGTTIGNLTYHYPKKEDLLAAIQLDLYTDFFDYSSSGKSPDEVFNRLLISLRVMERNRNENRFFYENIVELCDELEKIRTNVESFRIKVYEFYLSIFLDLRECGLMKKAIAVKKYQSLAFTVCNMAYIWRQKTTMYYDNTIPRIELSTAIADIIGPFFVDDGEALAARLNA